MTTTTSTPFRIARGVAAACLAATLLASARVHADDHAGNAGLTGAWTVQVTLRDCANGAPLGPAMRSLVTFHGDGTLSETAASLAFAPGQRSPGHGAWARTRAHTFSQEMIALVVFDSEPNLPGTPGFDPTSPVSPGFFAGWQTVSHTVRLTSADTIASSGTNHFYKATGELYRSGCSTATGQRFQ